MIAIALQQEIQKNFVEQLFARINEGGFFIIILILIIGFLGIILLAKGINFGRKSDSRILKMITLINSLGLFALVLGVFGQLLKLIETLDYLSSFEGTTPRDFADGLKTTMLPTLFGAFVFLITRFSSIILQWIKPLREKEV